MKKNSFLRIKNMCNIDHIWVVIIVFDLLHLKLLLITFI